VPSRLQLERFFFFDDEIWVSSVVAVAITTGWASLCSWRPSASSARFGP